MSLIDRLTAVDDTKISIHGFVSEYEEIGRSQITAQNVKDDFSLDSAGGTELDDIIATSISGRELKDVLYLAEAGIRYTDTASIKTRIGI